MEYIVYGGVMVHYEKMYGTTDFEVKANSVIGAEKEALKAFMSGLYYNIVILYPDLDRIFQIE